MLSDFFSSYVMCVHSFAGVREGMSVSHIATTNRCAIHIAFTTESYHIHPITFTNFSSGFSFLIFTLVIFFGAFGLTLKILSTACSLCCVCAWVSGMCMSRWVSGCGCACRRMHACLHLYIICACIWAVYSAEAKIPVRKEKCMCMYFSACLWLEII